MQLVICYVKKKKKNKIYRYILGFFIRLDADRCSLIILFGVNK